MDIFWESRVVGQVNKSGLKALIEGKALGANISVSFKQKKNIH